HGKATVADRRRQRTGGGDERARRAQDVDRRDSERERGSTIKAQKGRRPGRGGDHSHPTGAGGQPAQDGDESRAGPAGGDP
ncbi:hypothetical protein C3R30_22010, partial [Mycobacterium tuberculosis]